MPVPTKRDVKRFCEIDGWEELSRTDHHRYKRTLNNGEILRTRVSFGSGPAFDDPRLRQRVWRVQLGLESEAEFWETLRTGEPPRRGTPLEQTSRGSWLRSKISMPSPWAIGDFETHEVLELNLQNLEMGGNWLLRTRYGRLDVMQYVKA